jgi:hypothetical protein
MLCRSNGKALDRSGDFAKTDLGMDGCFKEALLRKCFQEGQSGGGPTKFQAQEFSGDRFRCGFDRGRASPRPARLWRDFPRGHSLRCLVGDGDRCARDDIFSESVAAAIALFFSRSGLVFYLVGICINFIFDRNRNARDIASSEQRQQALRFALGAMHAQDPDRGILGKPFVTPRFDVSPVLSQDHVLFHGHVILLSDSSVASEVDHRIMVNRLETIYQSASHSIGRRQPRSGSRTRRCIGRQGAPTP